MVDTILFGLFLSWCYFKSKAIAVKKDLTFEAEITQY